VAIKIQSLDLTQPRCQILIENLEDCRLFAEMVAKYVTTPLAIALSGTLGAGKTQWTRFFAASLGALPASITSPTFMLVHEYDCRPAVFHLDAYRIGDEDELLELGIEEMLDSDAITIVEWADRFPNVMPRNTLIVHLEVGESQESRLADLQVTGERAKSILTKLIADWS